MIRRQLISDELRYNHQTSPRKKRTFRGSNLFQPTILYQNRLNSQINYFPKNWLGKKFISWDGEFIQSYVRNVQLHRNNPNVISEFEIANFCKSGSYRILYVNIDPYTNVMYVRSKPNIETVPGRLNVFLTTDNTIVKVAYF